MIFRGSFVNFKLEYKEESVVDRFSIVGWLQTIAGEFWCRVGTGGSGSSRGCGKIC